ncbi:MAG: hypothetical protein HQL38_03160 [Alphaproteobacteria bacterium]|nr:hypothetical protein [Alphaproteobacteria bacterium]
MRVLSIRAPWWAYILFGGKDIENRDWRTNYRGPVLIHASKWFDLEEVAEDAAWARSVREAHSTASAMPQFTYRSLKAAGGSIVGMVDLIDCVSASDSPWFQGDYGFVLQKPRVFREPIPCRGHLGLFIPSDEVMAAVHAQLAA